MKDRLKEIYSGAKDIERIAEYHVRIVGPQSAEKITDKLLDTLQTLENQPFPERNIPIKCYVN